MGYHFLDGETTNPSDTLTFDSPEQLAEAICSVDSPEEESCLIQKIKESGDEKLLIPLLKHPLGKIREFAATAMWEIWLNEYGDVALAELKAGLSALEKKQYDQALRLFQNTHVHFPHWAEPINKVATTLYLMDCPRDSLAFCREVLKIKPHHFGAWHGLILCAIALKDWAAAREGLDAYRKLIPHAEEVREFEKILQEHS